jgi:hypothetical protein
LLQQRLAEVVVGRSELGSEADGLLEVTDGLLRLTLAVQGEPEVVVGRSELGGEADGLPEMVDGLL